MSDPRLPAMILVNANGHRDRVDLTTKIEFVFDTQRAIQVSVEESPGEPGNFYVKVQDVRTGVLTIEPKSSNTVSVRSERK